MRRFLATIAAAAVLAFAAAGASAATLTNDDVITLTKKLAGESGKLGKEAEDLIVKTIATSDCRFDVSTEQIVKLSDAKVPVRIIDLMIDSHREWRTRIKGAVQVALQGFKDGDPKLAERSLRELKGLGPDAIPVLDKDGLGSESAAVRAGTIEAIGQIAHRDGLEPVMRALLDREPAVRAAAAKALKSVVEDRAKVAARLTDILGSLDQPRDGAALALGHLRETAAAPEIRKLTDPANSPLLRSAAAAALGLMADRDSVDLLISCMLPDKPGGYNLDVCTAAAVSLARIGDPKAVRPMIKAFERYPQAGARLIGPLSRFRDPQVVETLIDALEHTDTQASDLAWEALKMLTGSDMKKSKQDWRDWWDLDGRKRF
ncbi:MAG TPA: HEAT repeat domain-containing protein [Planctomycetota bacterium]|nr:HEAT repeat domain-containing protein [Planctomycetota bacterium]